MDGYQSLRPLLVKAPPTIGTFFQSASPQLAEALGRAGVEFIVVDRQHASPGFETVEDVLRAADLTGLAVVVRLANHRSPFVNNYLDMGASGLMIPQVEQVEQVEQVVERMRYSQGRSLALGTRAGRFGHRSRDEHVEWTEREALVVPQIETKAGLENVEEIVALDAVEAVFVGTGDLSFSLGVDPESRELTTAVDTIIDTARDEGCGVGVYAPTRERIDEFGGRITYATLGSDLALVTAPFTDDE